MSLIKYYTFIRYYSSLKNGMARQDYSYKHKLLGLCRTCPNPLAQGNNSYCEYHRDKDRAHSRAVSKKAIIKLRNKCFDHYGKECNCCGISILEFLTIDHENGNGNIQRKELFGHNISGIHMYRWLIRNNFPAGFRILCMNCNWVTRYGTICPHQLER